MVSLSFKKIVERIEQCRLPAVHYVLAIAEGGLVPASLVALKLKVPLGMIRIRFRDPGNRTLYTEPKVFEEPVLPRGVRSVLIVDDVSVTGKTLGLAKSRIPPRCKVRTCVLKGRADHVLFPELRTCVQWPWNRLRD